MKFTLLASTIFVLMTGFSACSTVPDPAKVCTAEWIKPRAERAMNDFEKDTRKIFKTFRKSADRLDKGGKIGPLQMFAMMNAISSLGNKFENGRAMRDMRTLAQTCDDPELIKNAMTDFMRSKGISDQFISFINGFDEYKDLLDTGKRPDLKI